MGVEEWATAIGIGVSLDRPQVVTDEVLQDLADVLPEVAWLNLSDTRVTDFGVAALRVARKLEHITCANTNISPSAIEQLKSVLPAPVVVDFSTPSAAGE